MAMTTEETKQSAYQRIKEQLDKLFVPGSIPNVKAFKKIIADLRKRIKLLEAGTPFFASGMEDVSKAQSAIARLSGELQAYQERYAMIQERLKSNAV